jgi:formate--tetrahydrofolate ligase
VPVVVAINRFIKDTDAELEAVRATADELCAKAILCNHWAEGGGAGGLALAEQVCAACETPPGFGFLYDLDLGLRDKIETIATRIYGAGKVEYSAAARAELQRIEDLGYRELPVCMAKTPASLTDDPRVSGCPKGFTLKVTAAKVSAGAGFVVVYPGAIMPMPGLPRHPAALAIDIDATGNISGLF